MADGDLETILSNEKVHVYALYRGGEPAGYVELDYRQDNEVELAYFGLLPWHIGNGIGPWFLDWAVSTAWNDKPARLVVNTCNLDHPQGHHCVSASGLSTLSTGDSHDSGPRVANPSGIRRHAPSANG